MTTEKTRPEIPPGAAGDADAAATGNIRRGPLLGLVTLIAIGLFFGPNARKGPRSERVANPEGKVHYRRNLHNPTLFGDRHHADRVAGPDHELVAFAVYNPELWHLPEDWPLCRRADRRAVRWRNSVR